MKAACFLPALCVSLLATLAATANASDAFRPADELVWYDDLDDVSLWKAQPAWVGNPAPTATLASEKGVARFGVDQPSQGMKWSRDLPPISLAETPWLVVRYRAEGLNRQHGDYVIYLRDGNAKEQLSPLTFSEVAADGAWHLAAVDVSTLTDRTSVDQIAIQVQAGPTAGQPRPPYVRPNTRLTACRG